MSTSGTSLLDLENISLSFKGVKAITDISFAVREGEICALIGPNGAGKSSLLNIINGVYRPQQGVIRFAGEQRRRMSPHDAAVRGIARTFQNIALFKGMSVLDNILSGRNLKRRSTWMEQALRLGRARREDDRQRLHAERVIEFLRIQAWRQTPVGTLPYGLQKRVELGRALAAEPRLLLLDEPMAGMNAEEKREMSRFILEVNREFGTTVVLIEHDIGVVMGLSDHVVVLDYGRKIGDGTPEQVRNDPRVLAAYLGTRH
ncbi:ABC transporter ATP-binding protein [Phytopseudomonas dryadis]|uniref:ABC transporter ATP-binding protein n=1 Tax=Phytopseudomonas dryadis TaxID=2487520 RepID=A0ABY1Z9W4_9GAMM|nr:MULTISPECIES: ABC transporter ATP-binding protein [Pseudomonas]TBV06994.1 ABC transporter ATP-binding protein [Pseudomonas dryadis]TBV19613.1 ABC transporter ATP-binding protein [Pseudomonas sp. FRB 230]